MDEFIMGEIVKTNAYYNTCSFNGKAIKKGVILGIEKHKGFDSVLIKNERGHIVKIPSKYLVKIK